MSSNIFYWTPPSLDVVIATSHKVDQYDQSFDVGVYQVLAKGEWPKNVDTDAMCEEVKDAIVPIIAKHTKERRNHSMGNMNELLKSISLKSKNGDATYTYDCELARDNITVREFVEAVENSVNGRGQKFNEWWATVSMSIVGPQKYPSCARYTIYGGPSGSSFQDIVLNDTPYATIDNILNRYGKYIVDSCQWNGGWGSGGYYLKIKEGIAV